MIAQSDRDVPGYDNPADFESEDPENIAAVEESPIGEWRNWRDHLKDEPPPF